MKILLSTYSCFPSKVSEPGNAWRMIHEILGDHEIWAVIEESYADGIEAYLADHPAPHFHPVFLKLSSPLRQCLRGRGMLEPVYYHLWQERLSPLVRELHKRIAFDLCHHVTFGRYWSPSGLRVLDIPFIWGPVGAAETPPRAFVTGLPARARLFELIRDGMRTRAARSSALLATARAVTIGVGTTRESCEALRGLGVRRVEMLPQMALTDAELNSFDRLAPPPPGPFRAICIGRLLHWKGFDLAIRAFARFARTEPSAELWIVNDGPYRGRLESVAAESGIQSQVRFFGWLPTCSEVMDKLAQSHVLLHPAIHEGFGNVCLEALAAGRPVVCLDIGGPAAQVTADTGFIAPATAPNAAVEAMASFLARIHSDRSLLATMSANARARARGEFTTRKVGAAMRSFYDEAIAYHKSQPERQSLPNH